MKKIFQITLKTLQLYYVCYKNEIYKRILLFILVHVLLHYIIFIIFHLYFISIIYFIFFYFISYYSINKLKSIYCTCCIFCLVGWIIFRSNLLDYKNWFLKIIKNRTFTIVLQQKSSSPVSKWYSTQHRLIEMGWFPGDESRRTIRE